MWLLNVLRHLSRCGTSFTPSLILLLTLLLVECGGGGSNNPLWVSISHPDPQGPQVSEYSDSYSLYGSAYCDACPEGLQTGGSEICTQDSIPTNIGVAWKNNTTGASGETTNGIGKLCNCASFLSPNAFCTARYVHGWTAYNVPLAVGDNVIEIKAYDGSGNSAKASITINRR